MPVITTTSLPPAIVGVTYSQSLTASGGNGALVWSVASGTLPAGLSLSPAGLLSGTPTATVVSNFVVKVADSDVITGTADEGLQALSLLPLPANIPMTSNPLVIVILGASTSSCKNLDAAHGYNPADCWVNRFNAYMQTIRPGTSVINLAVAGTGTCGALPSTATIPSICASSGSANAVPTPHPIPDTAHNITKALTLSPSLIVVNYPGDDKIGVNTTVANLHTIQDAATAAGVPIWFANAQPDAFDAAVSVLRITQRDQVNTSLAPRVIDFWTPLANPATGMMQTQYINVNDPSGHPNDEGHRVIYEAAKATLAL